MAIYTYLNLWELGAVLFCLFMIIGSRFVTVGLGSKEETKTVQRESLGFQESKLRAKLEDATILGKFWNSKRSLYCGIQWYH